MSSVSSPVKQANTTDAAPVAVAGANGSAPVAVANSSEARMVARRKRSPLTPEEQAAKEAEFKLKPCFDFAESGSCKGGDACKFSHDASILATASAAKAARDAEREALKDQRAAAKIERDAKQAAAKVERDAAKAAAAASGATQVKEPKKKASKKQQQQQPSASPQSLTTPTSPVVLPTGPTTEPDLTHILVRRAISAKFPKATHKLNHSLKNKPFIIGITGGTASGKTTVCDEIRAKLGQRVAMLQMDRFYYSLPHDEPASSHNFDVPEAFDWDLFSETLRKLSTGIPVQVPRYSFETHQRLPKLDTFKPAEVIMVEGILTLHDPRIFEQFDLKVFIEADSDVRLARRIVRDIAERGRTVEGVIDQYINTVKPAHERYIQPSARQADIIVPHNGPKNGIAIDLLAQHISTEIYKRGATLVRQPKSPSSAAASASNSVANKTIAENGDAPTANGAPKAKKARKPRQPKEKSPAAPAADATVAAAPVDAPSQ